MDETDPIYLGPNAFYLLAEAVSLENAFRNSGSEMPAT
jgi:hypothetical protein